MLWEELKTEERFHSFPPPHSITLKTPTNLRCYLSLITHADHSDFVLALNRQNQMPSLRREYKNFKWFEFANFLCVIRTISSNISPLFVAQTKFK